MFLYSMRIIYHDRRGGEHEFEDVKYFKWLKLNYIPRVGDSLILYIDDFANSNQLPVRVCEVEYIQSDESINIYTEHSICHYEIDEKFMIENGWYPLTRDKRSSLMEYINTGTRCGIENKDEEIRSTVISELDIPRLVLLKLARHKIKTIGDILDKEDEPYGLLAYTGIGKTAMRAIAKALRRYGVVLNRHVW